MSDYPAVVMLSMWRNDAERRLRERVTYLLAKTYPALRWVWVVGDSSDDTEHRLREMAAGHHAHERITIARHDTGIEGEDPDTRIRRLSETANAWWEHVRPDDAYCLIHESDLISCPDVVERLLAAGKCPVAGWPVLELNGQRLFYDTWAYRRDGLQFSNYPPYHPRYDPDNLFEVDSVGSLWLFHAADIRAGARCIRAGALDLCAWMKAHGRSIWVDPRLTILQPRSLWSMQAPPRYEVSV